MEDQGIFVGLDIGTTKICAIVGRKNEHRKIEVLGIGRTPSTGVLRGKVFNIEKTVQAIREAVHQAETHAGVKIKSVQVGIAGQHIRSQRHRDNIVREEEEEVITQHDINILNKKMSRLSLEPGEEIVHVLPEDYIVDNEPGIKDPIGMCGIRLEANFHIITGQVNSIRNIYKCVERAGLTVKNLVLEPIASSESALSEEEKEAGVALVDIGGGTTDLAIFYEGIIRHTAVIPLGGNIVTEDIKAGCGVVREYAEKLKVNHGSALAVKQEQDHRISVEQLKGRKREISSNDLAMIIQARMEEILEHVYYEIRSSGYAGKLIGGVVVTGGGSQLRHLSQLVEYITGMDARIGYPTEHVVNGSKDADVRSPIFATGVGLVLKGIHAEEKTGGDTEEKKKRAKKGGSWFESVIRRGTKWLEDEDVDIE